MPDPKNLSFYNDLGAEKADLPNFILFDERQWNYIQRLYGLTPRERQIMEHVCKGLRNEDIAEDIDIALGTVKTHIRNVNRKTRTKSKMAILLRFIYDVNNFFQN